MTESITRQEIVEIIGDRATDDLLRAWGGTYFRFPREFIPDHPLEFVIGRYNAEILCMHFGDRTYDLPSYSDQNHSHRNALIIEKLLSGQTQSSVAADFGVSERTVRTIYTNHKRSNSHE
jgi:DNA-binding CsgD family transcriptional regulator